MAIYLLRLTWEQGTPDSKDRVVWGWHVQSETQPTAAQVAADFETARDDGTSTGLLGMLPANLEASTLQVYNSEVGGPPVDELLFLPGEVKGSGTAGPSEVQIVVTRWTADGLGRPRKTGRIYIGPLNGATTDTQYVGTSEMNRAGIFSAALHDAFVARGWTPGVATTYFAGKPTGFKPIVDYSVDNAWDTQRRRGVEATNELNYTPISE